MPYLRAFDIIKHYAPDTHATAGERGDRQVAHHIVYQRKVVCSIYTYANQVRKIRGKRTYYISFNQTPVKSLDQRNACGILKISFGKNIHNCIGGNDRLNDSHYIYA